MKRETVYIILKKRAYFALKWENYNLRVNYRNGTVHKPCVALCPPKERQ